MRPFFTVDPLENRIIDELRAWSAVGLETPNDFFNNLPPCPFAHQAWADQKVTIFFKRESSFQCLYSAISQYDDTFDVAILVDLYDLAENSAFHEHISQLNTAISKGFFIDHDIWLMGYHPEDDIPDFVDDSMEMAPEIEVEEEYAVIFIQRLSKLQESAYKLTQKGYYENYMQDKDCCAQYAYRERFYEKLRRNPHGSSEKESACTDAKGWFSQEKGQRWGLRDDG